MVQWGTPSWMPGRKFGRGVSNTAGYLASMLALAIASLAMIPAMLQADGAIAWGAIAGGQSIGAIAAVLVAYGWGVSGPTVVARGDRASRASAFADAFAVRMSIVFPVLILAASASAAVAPAHPWHAVLGAVQASTVGLSLNWFFIGMRWPFRLFFAETVPRVLGTVAGILAMTHGATAMVGLAAQACGMLLGVACCATVIVRSLRGERLRRSASVPSLLRRHAAGIGASLGSTCYAAAPVVIVALVAPAAQPLYAIADKVQRQVSVAMSPLASALQGWVPTARGEHLIRRARAVVGAAALFACCGAIALLIGGPFLLTLLGAGHVDVPAIVIALMACYTALSVFENLLARAILPAIGRLRGSAIATVVSVAIGLPLVALGAIVGLQLRGEIGGAVGALLGVIGGLLARTIAEVTMSVSAKDARPLPGAPSREDARVEDS